MSRRRKQKQKAIGARRLLRGRVRGTALQGAPRAAHAAPPARAIRREASGRETPTAIGPYSMRLEWDPRDSIYVVTVPELPGCTTHGATVEEAARKGREAIASWIDAARAWGDPIPPPREYDPAPPLAEA